MFEFSIKGFQRVNIMIMKNQTKNIGKGEMAFKFDLKGSLVHRHLLPLKDYFTRPRKVFSKIKGVKKDLDFIFLQMKGMFNFEQSDLDALIE